MKNSMKKVASGIPNATFTLASEFAFDDVEFTDVLDRKSGKMVEQAIFYGKGKVLDSEGSEREVTELVLSTAGYQAISLKDGSQIGSLFKVDEDMPKPTRAGKLAGSDSGRIWQSQNGNSGAIYQYSVPEWEVADVKPV